MIKYFLKNPLQTGTITSCHRKVAKLVTSHIDLENARNIVELGSGVGALTQEILNKKHREANLIAIEINSQMCIKLREKFPTLEIENQSAIKLPEILQKRSMGLVDVCISALPWTFFTPSQQDGILENIYQSLKEGGYFATVVLALPTQKQKNLKKKFASCFGNILTSHIIWQNIPPVHIYYCKKPPAR